MSVRRSVVAGIGAYLPEKIVTNADLAKIVDTSDEWVLERTGISERRMVAEGETTSDLAVKAAEAAMKAAGVTGEALVKFTAEMRAFAADYANPFYRLPMTFTEIFPVGVLVSLVSAGLLCNRRFLAVRRGPQVAAA